MHFYYIFLLINNACMMINNLNTYAPFLYTVILFKMSLLALYLDTTSLFFEKQTKFRFGWLHNLKYSCRHVTLGPGSLSISYLL